MIFKQNWEKADKQHQLPADVLEKIVKLACPDKKLLSHEEISGGRSNLNIKVNLEDDEQPFIVRIYLRDKDASYREKRLGTLLKQTVPIPLTYHIGDYKGYHFAITEFIPGITLRDFLLSATPHDVATIMYEIGALLAKITEHVFPEAGFFDKELNIVENASQDSYLTFNQECLQNKIVLTQLSFDTISKIHFYLKKNAHLFPDKNEKYLVHADFDPTNILVDKVDGVWRVMGILDWEFSHSGSVLFDIATMLRYAHQIPEESFFQGLKSGGIHLPDHWRITVHMLNLCSLLGCLTRADPKNRPKQCAGICSLISFCLRQLEAIRGTTNHQVECINNEVHRPAGYWTKQVHKFLHYLREQGFCAAPKPLGFDAQGREIVSFIKGEVTHDLLHQNASSLKVLTSAAKLLRAYHDASQNFLNVNSASKDWMLLCKNPQEVICHGDFAPYNLVLDGEQAIGIIDFDAAHPGPRTWDIAYALYRFAPFTNPDNEDGFGNIEDQILRARLFCNAYGLAEEKRMGMADLMIERLQNLIDFMMRSAQEGNKKYEQNIKEGHHLTYLKDIEHIKMHKPRIEDGIK